MEKEYTTKNIQIASFLYSSNIQFLGTTKIKNEFIFRFCPKEKAEELVQRYFSGTAVSNPRDLFARLHDLKDLIFS